MKIIKNFNFWDFSPHQNPGVFKHHQYIHISTINQSAMYPIVCVTHNSANCSSKNQNCKFESVRTMYSLKLNWVNQNDLAIVRRTTQRHNWISNCTCDGDDCFDDWRCADERNQCGFVVYCVMYCGEPVKTY